MCNIYDWFETLIKGNETNNSCEIYGLESKDNMKSNNHENYWKCLSGNIHPNDQQFCTCINDNLNYEKLV